MVLNEMPLNALILLKSTCCEAKYSRVEVVPTLLTAVYCPTP